MWKIITTQDVGPWAYDTVVARFSDHEWDKVQRTLAHLRRVYGRGFKLLDH